MDVHSCIDREARSMENKARQPKSYRPADDNIDGTASAILVILAFEVLGKSYMQTKILYRGT